MWGEQGQREMKGQGSLKREKKCEGVFLEGRSKQSKEM